MGEAFIIFLLLCFCFLSSLIAFKRHFPILMVLGASLPFLYGYPAWADEASGCIGVVISDYTPLEEGNGEYPVKKGEKIEMLHEYEGDKSGNPLTYAVHGGSVYDANNIRLLNCHVERRTKTSEDDPGYTLVFNDIHERAATVLYDARFRAFEDAGVDYADSGNAAYAMAHAPNTLCAKAARKILAGNFTGVSQINDDRVCQNYTQAVAATSETKGDNNHDAIIAGGIVLFVLSIYFFPTIVAINRRVLNKGGVIMLNLLLGWTLIGWIIALVMAYTLQTREQFERLTRNRQ